MAAVKYGNEWKHRNNKEGVPLSEIFRNSSKSTMSNEETKNSKNSMTERGNREGVRELKTHMSHEKTLHDFFNQRPKMNHKLLNWHSQLSGIPVRDVQDDFDLDKFCYSGKDSHLTNGILKGMSVKEKKPPQMKWCQKENCYNKPTYGKLYSMAVHCNIHKLENEFPNQNRYPKCKYGNCKKRALYVDIDDNWPKRCNDHRTSPSFLFTEILCNRCELVQYAKNGGSCFKCTEKSKISKTEEKRKREKAKKSPNRETDIEQITESLTNLSLSEINVTQLGTKKISPSRRLYEEKKISPSEEAEGDSNFDEIINLQDNEEKEQITPFRKKYEEEFKAFIDGKMESYIYNKTITWANYRFRPDFQFYLPDKLVAIEVDENQHKYYKRYEEANRMEIIFKDAPQPVIFIRFNPNSYKDRSGKIIQSPPIDRYETVWNTYQKIKYREEDKKSSTIYLYYDDFDINHIVEINSSRFNLLQTDSFSTNAPLYPISTPPSIPVTPPPYSILSAQVPTGNVPLTPPPSYPIISARMPIENIPLTPPPLYPILSTRVPIGGISSAPPLPPREKKQMNIPIKTIKTKTNFISKWWNSAKEKFTSKST